MTRNHVLRAAIVFALAGALSRFTFRYVETRWQIAAFWAVAALYQFAVRSTRGSWAALALDGLFATVAIVAVKVAVEGKL